MKRYGLVIILGLAVFAAGCSQSQSGVFGESNETTASQARAGRTIETGAGSYTRVEPETLRRIIENRNPLVINTHVPYEGELPATDRFIPYDQIAASSKLPEDKSAPVVVYCKTGPMSEQAAQTLLERGYTEVVDLGGGMDAWERAELPLKNRR